MSIQPATPTTPPGRARALVTGLLLSTLALGAVAGCAKPAKSSGDNASQGLSGVDSTASTGATPDSGSTGGGASGSGGASASPTTKPSSKPSNAPAGPRIDAFAVVGKASCGSPGGPGFNAVPGSVTLLWSATGATMVGLSIDDTNFGKSNGGHGAWSDYNPTDTKTDIPFSCDGPAGNRTHTYTLTTIGGGAIAAKTLTLTAYWQGPPNP